MFLFLLIDPDRDGKRFYAQELEQEKKRVYPFLNSKAASEVSFTAAPLSSAISVSTMQSSTKAGPARSACIFRAHENVSSKD